MDQEIIPGHLVQLQIIDLRRRKVHIIRSSVFLDNPNTDRIRRPILESQTMVVAVLPSLNIMMILYVSL